MKYLILFCTALFISSASASGQVDSLTYENSLLWKISGNGLTENSFLFGTIHVGDARVFQYGDSLKSAINQVDALYGEIDLTDMAAQLAVLSRMMMDKNLSDLVSPQEFKLIQERAKGTAVAPLINRMKPIFTVGELTRVLLPADSITVLDLHLQHLALKLDKEVGGIETIEEQFDAIDKISLEYQIEMLLEFCQDYEKQKSDLELLMDLYLKKDLNGILEFSQSTLSSDEEEMDMERSLNSERNIVMVKRLKALMPRTSLVFAVGTLHLPGEEGLIELLRSEGYTVEAVINAN